MFAEFIIAITIIEGTRRTLTINCSIIIDQMSCIACSKVMVYAVKQQKVAALDDHGIRS